MWSLNTGSAIHPIREGLQNLKIDGLTVPSNMCTKFHLKMLNVFFSYEVRLKLCNDADDDNKDITISRTFLDLQTLCCVYSFFRYTQDRV